MGIFDSLGNRHAVVEAEGAGKRRTHLSVDGDVFNIAEGCKAKNLNLVLCLKFEVEGIASGGREG